MGVQKTKRTQKATKIRSRLKELERKSESLHKKYHMWEVKRIDHYDECRKKGIYNAVTYGIIGDYDYLNKIKEPAKKQLALRHIARHKEIIKKRDSYFNPMLKCQQEIYKLKQELKKT